jgi:hypothetical protein
MMLEAGTARRILFIIAAVCFGAAAVGATHVGLFPLLPIGFFFMALGFVV